MNQDSTINILNDWIKDFNQEGEVKIENLKILQGAKDILAEIISEDPDLRKELRELTSKEGIISSSVRPEFKG